MRRPGQTITQLARDAVRLTNGRRGGRFLDGSPVLHQPRDHPQETEQSPAEREGRTDCGGGAARTGELPPALPVVESPLSPVPAPPSAVGGPGGQCLVGGRAGRSGTRRPRRCLGRWRRRRTAWADWRAGGGLFGPRDPVPVQEEGFGVEALPIQADRVDVGGGQRDDVGGAGRRLERPGWWRGSTSCRSSAAPAGSSAGRRGRCARPPTRRWVPARRRRTA
jgi:hypothetical protein